MPLDKDIIKAITHCCDSRGQRPELSKQLIRWLEQLAEGNANLNTRDETEFRIEQVLEAVEVE